MRRALTALTALRALTELRRHRLPVEDAMALSMRAPPHGCTPN